MYIYISLFVVLIVVFKWMIFWNWVEVSLETLRFDSINIQVSLALLNQ